MKKIKNCIKVFFILFTVNCFSVNSSDKSNNNTTNLLILNSLNSSGSSTSCPLNSIKTTQLPNRLAMSPEYGCIKIDYGNDVKCTEDLGKWGQTTGANQCIKENADGTKKTTKIEYVQEVIKTYIDKMKAQKVDITPALRKNAPTLFMFNNVTDKNDASSYTDAIGKYGQDLQADETFVLQDSSHGFSTVANKRNAAMEEIIHLLHNSGISETKPAWQTKLEFETSNALNPTGTIKTSKLNWTDADNNDIGDDENRLPRADLDDEFFADGVEAFFNVRGGGGYVKTDFLCISRNCTTTTHNE